MKCTSAAANAVNVEDFGKVIVEVLQKTHYNRECPSSWTLPVLSWSRMKDVNPSTRPERKYTNN